MWPTHFIPNLVVGAPVSYPNFCGTAMYVCDSTSATIRQWTFEPPWDMQSAVYTYKSVSVSSQDTNPQGIDVSPNGLRLYLAGNITDTIYEYVFANDWDLSTLSYSGRSKNINAQDATPHSVRVSPFGDKMFVLGSSTDTIYQYTFGTAWDVSTTTYSGISFYVGGTEISPTGISFSRDGSLLFLVGQDTDTIYKINCPTPWDLTGASFSGDSISIATVDTAPKEVFIDNTGEKIYAIGEQWDRIYEWDMDPTYQLSTITSLTYLSTGTTTPTGVAFGCRADAGYSLSNTIRQYGFQEPIPGALFTANFVLSSDGARALIYQDNLTSTYWSGGPQNDLVIELKVATPFDISTMDFIKPVTTVPVYNPFISKQRLGLLAEDNFENLYIKPDGSKIYYGWRQFSTGKYFIYQIDLTTPFQLHDYSVAYTLDLSTTSAPDPVVDRILFSANGMHMYIWTPVGSFHEYIEEFILPTPWDLSTAYYQARKYIFSPHLFFQSTAYVMSNDGTQLIGLGTGIGNERDIVRAVLGTPYDITSMGTPSVIGQVPGAPGTIPKVVNPANTYSPADMYMSPDGAYAYLSLEQAPIILRLDLTTPWDFSSFSLHSKSYVSAVASPVSGPFEWAPDGRSRVLLSTSADELCKVKYDPTLPYYIYGYEDYSTFRTIREYINIKALTGDIPGVTNPRVYIPPDGSKLFITGGTDLFYEFSFGTAWDLTTLTYTGSTSIGYAMSDFDFSLDGTWLAICQTNSLPSIVRCWSLSTPWDLSTASYVGGASLASTTIRGIAYSKTGNKVFFIDTNTNVLKEYNVSVPFNISAANLSFVQSAAMSSYTADRGIKFNHLWGDRFYTYNTSMMNVWTSD